MTGKLVKHQKVSKYWLSAKFSSAFYVFIISYICFKKVIFRPGFTSSFWKSQQNNLEILLILNFDFSEKAGKVLTIKKCFPEKIIYKIFETNSGFSSEVVHYVKSFISVFQEFASISKLFFWQGEPAVGSHSMGDKHFPNISSFPEILSLKSFGKSWGTRIYHVCK